MASLFFEWEFGDVAYTKRGWGDPILLLHNLYPGASRDEFEHNVDALSHHFTVYTPDLLGYGESSAPHIRYTANTYTTLIRDFMNEVIGSPAHVVASGLTCAYVAEIAVWRKESVRSIVMICPRSEPTGLDLPRWVAPLQHFLISSPMLGNGLYETLSCPYEITTYLKYCFHHPKHVTRGKIERLVRNAAKPGGVFPYASLVTGYLDSHLLKTLPHVEVPVMLLWGRQAKPTPVEHSVRLAAMLRRGRLQVVENAGSWVHDEQSKIVNDLVHEFAEGREFAVAGVTG
jgi:pimeloyl-ACP methyl ester carboxylesterase